MKLSLVLTVIGPDRPGIVERLAHTVAAHDGNWLESRMARLAGQFAGILRASVPERMAAPLEAALAALASEGLRVVVARDVFSEEQQDERLPLRLELVGNDRPGIVREISRLLASHGINVEELVTECEEAPMAGGTLFRATAELRAPRELSIPKLHGTLEALANDLMVDLTLREEEE